MIGIHLPLLILLTFFLCPANAKKRENNICVYFFVAASKYLLFLWKEFYLTFIWIIGFKLSCLLKSLQILGCNCTDAATSMPLVAVKVPTITDREMLTEPC